MCAPRRARDDVRERGSVMVLAALMIAGLVAFAALALDVGVMMTARTQLQASADAAARAAIQELRDSGSKGRAKNEAIDYARLNRAFNRTVKLDPSDVEVGHFNYGSRVFTPGLGFGAPAVRVVARATEGSRTGAIPQFFSQILGRNSADVTAAAVASVRRRDVCISQDRTLSFREEFRDAQKADRTFVNQMDAQGLPGDRVGLVSFARDRKDEQEMTPLTGGGVRDLEEAIDGMVVCQSGGRRGGPCYGTDISQGLDGCREMMERVSTSGDAEQVIVLVTDGAPCIYELGGAARTRVGQIRAQRSADRAGDAGINIFSITLDQGGGSGGCYEANPEWNESLARGFGRGFTTTSSKDLDDLLLSILTQMPVYLVE